VPVYDDIDANLVPPEEIKCVTLCYGQFYYDLKEKREELKKAVSY
jgi:2-oxoglutarate dehydrogenase complex dehydrogenase (E1) component-like enzyme